MHQYIKPKLLICTTFQFGYLIDTYKYCEYANEAYDITYLCWDYKQPKISLSNTKVYYVSRKGNLIVRNYRLLKKIYKSIQEGSFNKVFVVYIQGISFIQLLLPSARIHLDIRTASVHKNWIKRNTRNLFLRLETLLFKNVSVISKGVAQSLGIRKYSILPLGGENFKKNHYKDSKITFIYVGTLQFREFLTFVKAFHQYTISSFQQQKIILRIIGDSPSGELQQIQKFLESNNISNIELLGRINQKDLPPYFDDADIGVSYIPITPWFTYQPPTKTYEYLVSGLPVLATETFENKRVICKENGILIKDNIESIKIGLNSIINNYNNNLYDFNKIKQNSQKYSWKYILKESFNRILSM